MKAALIQLNVGTDKHKNVKKAEDFVLSAIGRKAEFILLPELFVYQGDLSGKLKREKVVETVFGETITLFRNIAAKYRVSILAGSIYEKAAGTYKVYNTSVLIDPKGGVQCRYRKRNLFDAVIGKRKISESKKFISGKRGAMGRVKGFKIGMSICYDLRFPEIYRKYSNNGAEILCIPSAFTDKTGQAHWEVLLRSRAIENLCYVLAPNQCGVDGKKILNYGSSMVVNPWGEVIAKASKKREQIVFAKIEKNVIKEKRRTLPKFQ